MRFQRLVAAVLIPTILAGCGTTVVVESNPSLARADEEGSAKVYFLRTDTSYSGEQRHAFTVFLDGRPLVTLAEKEYTLLHLKPGSGVLTVGSPPPSLTREQLGEISAQGTFSFQPGSTSYVGFRRAVFSPHASLVVPVLLGEKDAAVAVNNLKAVGLAQGGPIEAVAVAKKPEPEGCYNWFGVGDTARHSCLNLVWEIPALVVMFPIVFGAMIVGGLEETASKGK